MKNSQINSKSQSIPKNQKKQTRSELAARAKVSAAQWRRLVTGSNAPFGHDRFPTVLG